MIPVPGNHESKRVIKRLNYLNGDDWREVPQKGKETRQTVLNEKPFLH